MIERFMRVARGYASSPDASVRLMVARAVEDLGDILNRPLEAVPDAGSDDAVLAALDFDIADTQEDAGDDPALARLLPAMSLEDADLAEELRLDTQRRIRNAKARQLRLLHDILLSDDDRVLVPDGSEHEVLSALTDVRLLIAERLQIRDADDIDRLRDAHEAGDRATTVLAEVYAFLTWWQDSLLQAMGAAEPSP